MSTFAFRATRSLLQDSKEYVSSHTYHYTEIKTPFWRNIINRLRVNPEIGSGMPLVADHRNPPPGSRPEHHSIPPSKASDIANNRYYERDFRRMYPKLEMVTQESLTKLLLAQPNEDGTKSIPAPGSEAAAASASTALTIKADPASPEAFTEIIAQAHSVANGAAYSASNLPPVPPFKKAHHILKHQPGAVPHDEHAYYPAENYA